MNFGNFGNNGKKSTEVYTIPAMALTFWMFGMFTNLANSKCNKSENLLRSQTYTFLHHHDT